MSLSITELPFNHFIGLQRAEDPGLLKLPAHGQYLNHLGTVHASALMALAEASSGEFLLREAGSIEGLVPVVRRMESKFRRPANGEVTATVTCSPEILETMHHSLASKGRTLIEVPVEVRDASGQLVLTATVKWFLAKA